MLFTNIAHIGLTVSDLGRSVAFYKDILELEYLGTMKMSGPGTEKLFGHPGCQAEVAYLRSADSAAPPVELIHFLIPEAAPDKPDLFKTSISELCFSTDDIDRDYRKMLDRGVEFLSDPQDFDSTAYGFGRSRAVYFKDPDGNILEIIQPLP